MRTAAVVAVSASMALVVSAQQTPPPQAPPQSPPPTVTLQSSTPPDQQPVFRAGADVIRLDVSVLDKDRRPVRGLTADDFTVLEDGKPQRVVAASEIDVTANDPEPTAWMRHVPSDIAYNNLSDQIADGRLFALVLDDVNVPWDDLDIIHNARVIARDVIDHLAPSDVAAVVFPRDGGRTEDFTNDREKLDSAIDRFDPREPDVYNSFTPVFPSYGGDTMRSSPIMGRSTCDRAQPVVPAFEAVVGRMATVANRRKTIVFVSTGAPIDFAARTGCAVEFKDRMLDVFARAARANINIYSIDPAGYDGYARYLENPIRRGGRPAWSTDSPNQARAAARLRHDFLETMADYTGATATVNSDDVAPGIDRIFSEAALYYLVGYQTSNGQPDGRYRKIEVKVNRPGFTVRTRAGYFAAKTGGTRDAKDAPSSQDLNMVGMMRGTALPLRATAVPIALTGQGRDADVAVVLTVELPSPRGPVDEQVTVVRNLYDGEGRPGPPVVDKLNLSLQPSTGDELRYDVLWRLSLAPGRYQLRLNATSKLTDRSGSVFPDIYVPDFTRPGVAMSNLVLGMQPVNRRTDVLAGLLPISPTTARDFAPGDDVAAFLRVFQGGTTPPVPISMNVQVLDVKDRRIVNADSEIAADAFVKTRAAAFQFALPLKQLDHGPYLVSVTARAPGGPPVRRDLVFRVR